MIFILSFLAVAHHIKDNENKDPKEVIIDEFIGQSIPIYLYEISHGTEKSSNEALIFYGICFVLFRFFDIAKPFPVNFFDKKFKNSFGVIMDDVIAGFYVVLSLICFMVLNSYFVIMKSLIRLLIRRKDQTINYRILHRWIIRLAAITSISGASKIFNLGLVTYSNQAKIKILKVNKSIIKKYGAVSYECCYAMVNNLSKISKASINVSITGIAGTKRWYQKKTCWLSLYWSQKRK